MGRFRVFSILLLIPFLSFCGGAERPVSLPIPFAGALTSDSRIVVASGNPVGGSTSLSLSFKTQSQPGCTQFQTFNSNGSVAGNTELCESTVVTSTPFVDGRRDNFFVPASVNFTNGDRAAANVECFDFPYSDTNVVVPPNSELRKGACSAVLEEGDGSFESSVGRTTITYRYVAITRLENDRKKFDQMLESSWVLGRVSGGFVESGTPESNVISVLLLNGFATIEEGVPLKAPLFCEGQDPNDVENACGSIEFTWLGGEFQNGQRLNSLTNVTVCEGDSCLPTTNALFVDDFIPELSENMIASITEEVMQTGMGFSLLTGGIADNAVMTQHDPISCNPNDPNDHPQLTGKFREPGCAGRLQLDYRCLVLVNIETGEQFTFAGTFIITTTN